MNTVYDDKWIKKSNNLIAKYPNYYLREFKNFNTKLSYRTLHNYIRYISAFLNNSKKDITEIGFDDYTEYMASIRNSTPSNQIVAYSALKKYSKYLYASGKTAKDYMDSIERPNATERQETITKRAKGYLTKEEITQYINNVKNSTGYREAKYWKERDLCLVQLFLVTGIRESGIWKLDVNDINFENKELITTEKRGKVRTYPLSDNVLESCRVWLIERRRRARANETALFVSENGGRLSTERMRDIIHSYARDIKGKNITPHKLRATYGTQVFDATRDIYLTQIAMGHSSPHTTELYIRGQDDNNMNVAANVMSNLI